MRALSLRSVLDVLGVGSVMTTTPGNATLTDESRFEVLGLVGIALPGPWWWHTEDMNDPGAVGAIFRCYEQGNENELGYLLVADVSLDPSEPDIGKYEDSRVPELDRFLESEIRSLMAHDGREMIRWMSSHLNRRSCGKALITAYIARDQGRDRQYIDVRFRTRQRNVVVAGCFDVDRADQLATPIFYALNDATPLNNRPS
jgi:hypothetical protein